MNSNTIVTTNVMHVTDLTLERAPGRALTFLRGAGEKEVSELLQPVGWTKDRLDEGYSLLNALRDLAVFTPPAPHGPVAAAVAICEGWKATGLVRARAMLLISYPDVESTMFHDFDNTAKGAQAVLDVDTFLERRTGLEKGVGRKGNRKADHAALEVIERSGTTREVLIELASAVRTARTYVASPVTEVVDPEVRRQALRRIYAWLTAWSDVARTVLKRRDYQIRLGIAKRKPRGKKAVVAPSAPAAPSAPSVAKDDVAPNSHAA
jgi:hypothetical protein